MNRKLNLANLTRLIQIYSHSLARFRSLDYCSVYNVHGELFQYEFSEVNVRVLYMHDNEHNNWNFSRPTKQFLFIFAFLQLAIAEWLEQHPHSQVKLYCVCQVSVWNALIQSFWVWERMLIRKIASVLHFVAISSDFTLVKGQGQPQPLP